MDEFKSNNNSGPCPHSLVPSRGRGVAFAIMAIAALVFGIVCFGEIEMREFLLLCVGIIASLLSAVYFGALRRIAPALIAVSICLLCAINLTTPPAPRPPGYRSQCKNNIRQLITAIMTYDSHKRRLPPAIVTDAEGRPMHSWRVAILPYIEENGMYSNYRFKEPWNSPHNSKVTAERPEIFHCPSDKQSGESDTSYVAVLSPNSVWGINQSKSIDGIKDGTDKTILLIEMKNSGIHWAEPRDLDLSNLPPSIDKQKLFESLSNHIGGVCVAFADGPIEFLPFAHSSLEYLEALVSRDGGEAIAWENRMPRVVPKAKSSVK